MSLQESTDRVASLMHTLATADVINNTFGMTNSVLQGLQAIHRQLPAGKVSDAFGEEGTQRLRELMTYIEENTSLFGIPEKWLINNVVNTARDIRRRLDL
jgi:hypothetical protein